MKKIQVHESLLDRLAQSKIHEVSRNELVQLVEHLDRERRTNGIDAVETLHLGHMKLAIELHDLLAECRRQLLGQHQDSNGTAEVDGCYVTWSGRQTQEQWNRIESAKDRIIDFINSILKEEDAGF